MNYYWVRIYDYKYDDELSQLSDSYSFEKYKGVLLDEYYLSGEALTRQEAKALILDKSNVSKFAKGKTKQDCVYAILLNSEEVWYNRFTKEIDDFCFCCHHPIKGKEKDFVSFVPGEFSLAFPIKEEAEDSVSESSDSLTSPLTISKEKRKFYFCSYDCYKKTLDSLRHVDCNEWQTKDDYKNNGGTYGYIYHIYNRKTNKHYIGQTLFMPFFRWQEHVKSGLKGDICDLTFSVITEVKVKDKNYLNDIEAWWISKYIADYGRDNVINNNIPKISLTSLIDAYNVMVVGQSKLNLF